MVTSTHLRLTRRVPTLKEMPKSRKMEAEMAYGGPLFGMIASLACGALCLATDLRLFLSLANTGFFLNLFNLIPIRPLDGGRVAQIFSKRAWILGGSMLGAHTSLCTPTNTCNRDIRSSDDRDGC